MVRLPATISPILWAGTPISLARRYCESPIGRRNSSSSNSPGVTGFSLIMPLAPSMVVNDLDILGAARRPAAADPELIVHPDAVLPGAVPLEPLEPIAWRHPQVFQP